MSKKVTKKDLAEFFMKQQHPNDAFDFEIAVSDIPDSKCFLLRTFNPQKEVKRVYFVCLVNEGISENSSPFYKEMLGNFQNIETNPAANYWVGYIQVDIDLVPSDSRIFVIPEELKQFVLNNID